VLDYKCFKPTVVKALYSLTLTPNHSEMSEHLPKTTHPHCNLKQPCYLVIYTHHCLAVYPSQKTCNNTVQVFFL